MKLPKLNKKYNCFDDGKITSSRLYTVKIRKIVPYNKANISLRILWEEKKKSSLNFEETDYFFIAESDYGLDFLAYEVFAKTKRGYYFSFSTDSLIGGLLDIDGEITKTLVV